MQETSSDYVTSLAKGLAVIQSFGVHSESQTLSNVAQKTGFSRATARRFLLTLHALDYASYDGKYFKLTPKVLTLGQAYLSSLSFWDVSRFYLEEVSRQTNESCSMAILDGDQAVYVARAAASHHIMSVALYVGVRLPAHATSMGQVLLAEKTCQEFIRYLEDYPLKRFTSRTLTEKKTLRARLDSIRNHGFALVDQELEVGLRSIAVPVHDHQGKVIAAMNIGAHVARISKTAMLREYLPHLQTAAQKISQVV